MKKTRPQWYVIAYDIREPKRLKRLHYYLKQEAVALQKSVFLLNADRAALKSVVTEIRQRVSDRDDDVRLYPIWGPGAIWGAGQQSRATRHLYTAEKNQGAPKKRVSFFKLFRKEKRS